MKNKFFILILLLLISCQDSTLIVDNINFSSSSLQFCSSNSENLIFFKIKESESLILILSDPLPNQDGISTRYFDSYTYLVYRKYDGNINKNYFCSQLTPANPKLITELTAENGEIVINTSISLNSEGEINYISYNILISNLILKNENGEILIQDNLDFGNYGFSI